MSHSGFTGQHLPFVGFTYTTDSCFADRSSVRQTGLGQEEAGAGGGGQEVEAFERRIRRLEQEKQELNRKLQGETCVGLKCTGSLPQLTRCRARDL